MAKQFKFPAEDQWSSWWDSIGYTAKDEPADFCVVEIDGEWARKIIEMSEVARKLDVVVRQVLDLEVAPDWFQSKNEDDDERDEEVAVVDVDGELKVVVESGRDWLEVHPHGFYFSMNPYGPDGPDEMMTREIRVEELAELFERK